MTKSSTPIPQLSLITVNYNGLSDTLDLLESIYSHIKSVSFEVIVVDNASNNPSEISTISNRFPLTKTISSPQNLGFAGGNNLGMELAIGDFIMLINNDTLITEDHFDALLDRFNFSRDIGALSPKIIFAEPKKTIQFAGYTPLSSITMRNSVIGYREPDDGRLSTPSPIPYCHGAAMIIKKEALKKVGKMPELFFLYYEELDWCSKFRRMGYELWYEPCQTIIHKESCATGNDSPLKLYYMTRNRLLYAYRNLPFTNCILSIIYQTCIAIPKGFFVYLLKGNFTGAKAILKGGIQFFFIPNKKR